MIPPKAQEREYSRDLRKYTGALFRAIREHLIPALPSIARGLYVARPDTKMDDADELLRALKEVRIQVGRELTEGDLQAMALRRGVTISDLNRQGLTKGIKSVVSVDVLMAEPWLKNELLMFAASNANLITKIGDDTMNRIQSMAFDGFRQGVRWEELAKNIEEYADPDDGFPASRAKLIARDQTNKLNGQLTQLRQQELGVDQYIWRTVGDERVRDSHAANDGQIFAWDDPPAGTGNPGDDINCRCYGEPYLADFLPSGDEGDDE